MIPEGSFLPVYGKFELLDEQSLIPNWCWNHFGLPREAFEPFRFWRRRPGKSIWIAPKSLVPVDHNETVSFGLLVMRKSPPKGKPTSIFLQRFGGLADRNVYEISPEMVTPFLMRRPTSVQPIDDKKGYAIVRSQGAILGCGRIVGQELISEVPKHWLAETF